MSTCVAAVPGCQDCEMTRSPDHECGQLCHMIAEMVGDEEGHRIWHQAHYCRRCGAALYADGVPIHIAEVHRHGCCVTWLCPAGCGAKLGSVGPINCHHPRPKPKARPRSPRLHRRSARGWRAT